MMPPVPRSEAVYHVLALVSGLPPSKRYSRLILMLQAYFDDSTEQGNALIFAGYLQTVDAWLRFSADWDQILGMPPKMRPFKMRKIRPHQTDACAFSLPGNRASSSHRDRRRCAYCAAR